jgi:hypothetical protein
LASNSIISQNQNILSNDHGYTNNYNKINEKMQYLHGPGRLQAIYACNLHVINQKNLPSVCNQKVQKRKSKTR